ncbi:hypothetical protein ACOZE3_32810 [Streptomyces cinereoruber]|uniref:hypothetical protein n=1 Tax=Streptomyces cinereoruber TaxID=67260 RepID=UPI003BF52B29
MMFGYADDWWVLFLYPVLLWVPFGPFLMGAAGAWCAARPGWRPRLWSVLLPLVPVGVSAAVMVLPLDQEKRTEDLVGYATVYIGGITLLPWLLGYGTTRLVRAARARRERRERRRGSGGGGS